MKDEFSTATLPERGSRSPGASGRRSQAYLEQSALDLKEARRLGKERRHLDSAYLSLQAAINALTSVCLFHGMAHIPNHGAMALLAACVEVEPQFSAPEAACQALDEVQGRSPYHAGRDAAEEKRFAKACQSHAAAVLKAVEAYLKALRKHRSSS